MNNHITIKLSTQNGLNIPRVLGTYSPGAKNCLLKRITSFRDDVQEEFKDETMLVGFERFHNNIKRKWLAITQLRWRAICEHSIDVLE